MIFYHPECDLRFSDYGIEIPIVDDRAERVFASLKYLYPYLNYADLSKLEAMTSEDLKNVHNEDFIQRLLGTKASIQAEVFGCYELVNEMGQFERYNPKNQKKDFKELVDCVLFQVAMTHASTQYALNHGFSYFLGGGMHHAMSFAGRGFCLVNDIVITLRKMQKAGQIKTAWVVDVDVHKGDGAPEILQNDKSISTFSIHMKEGWPLNSGSLRDPWFIPSTLDVGIEPGEEREYLTRLQEGLVELEKIHPNPDIVIVVNGADPYEHDELPSATLLNLSKEELLERDKFLYNFFKAKNIPQSYVMAGGYGHKSWEIYFQFLKYVGETTSIVQK